MNSAPKMLYRPEANHARIRWDISRRTTAAYDAYWKNRGYHLIPPEIFAPENGVWLEVGAGTGWFFIELAKRRPAQRLVAIERCRHRGNRLLHRARTAGVPNLSAYRGNAIPVVITGIPSESVERIYILYPCPFPKNSQRKNRWYAHPAMQHLVRILKPGGLLIWASDQKFYIDEARFVCERMLDLEPLVHGQLGPNAYNDLADFPSGRTKFEASFLERNLPCFELVVRKKAPSAVQ